MEISRKFVIHFLAQDATLVAELSLFYSKEKFQYFDRRRGLTFTGLGLGTVQTHFHGFRELL